MNPVYHALVLNLRQPSGNLEALLRDHEWEARELLLAIDRIPRSLWQFEDIARVHLSLSGTLLETLANPDFQQRVYGIVKCGDLLWHLQNQKIFQILGTGYYHPVLPLIPSADWLEQLKRWLGIGRHLFGRHHFNGFWPPEMGFCMELIPLLKQLGYRYVLVDSEHVEPLSPMRWEEVRYRPHLASFTGEEIVVIVRDRSLSDAQQSGMDTGWHHGLDFVQWTGSQPQKDALRRIAETSDAFHALRRRTDGLSGATGEIQHQLEEAHWRLLRAETSCNLFWGEAWVPRCHRDLEDAWAFLARVSRALPPSTPSS